ncbi:bifunctional UDP-N-acetylglucosamine pyrophosphorylase / Glucosamine-1-phosphate N-acetyltransferase [Atopomonas hussainii]|uniref:Bifunctional protein GlmU n=1 Tax=Atopomonas hussainii TaxID=1429083 RepID=A0A1H7FIJ2_9GAMM|nr:bifunctional UDP-N-acetylglucosamine diphosphorylase/glucosamine-1-phosphate N-acetyltransferase GlmU [Atopomonas hussainii]SEK25604.1 bifunctional UDP-N-acetylglucosamine pyrophosphorylase / Glucosamine-1-phosphate N-acetyltransferase [Atopomonas hussainii]
MTLEVIILAAGQGTRMRSALPKVLHPVAGKAMLGHVIDAARELKPSKIHVVIGHGAELVRERHAAPDINFAVQAEQLGTGHAVAQAQPEVGEGSTVLVLYGDVPLIQASTLQRLLAQVTPEQIALLTVNLADPTGYGRIVRGADGAVQAIVEQKDASEAQKQIREGNTGILAVPGARLGDWLGRLSNSNAQGEYYLTDVIAMAVSDGLRVATEQPSGESEVLGANDRVQLAQLERFYQARQVEALMRAGATVLDPARLDVRGNVSVGKDVLLDVNVILEGNVELADGVQVGAHCVLKDCRIGAGTVIKPFSHIDGAELAADCDIGPYARLRPGTALADGVKVGNFVETKKAKIAAGSKVNHLSYIGDAEVGTNCNIGAGTITCNYDGVNKFKTVLGDDVFIGSNNSLVAPVTIGNGATTGAGSTVTQDVPDGALAVGRAKQRTIDTWKRPVKQ